jgi:hypothetical protein
LRARLQRIREVGAPGGAVPGNDAAAGSAVVSGETARSKDAPLPGPDWVSVGYMAAKRSVELDFTGAAKPVKPQALPAAFPRTMGILVPDLIRYTASLSGDDAITTERVCPGDLVFFDLETTGLGGAGTVAFLAAFGRFVPFPEKAVDGQDVSRLTATSVTGHYRLRIDQYLLLDYPGENDFLEAVLKEFQGPSDGLIFSDGPEARPPLIVTYNGKTFDSQILKTRCLMNGIVPPEYHHADLLHPARRLWKRILPSCTQGNIEVSVLGLDRTGDIPGAMAPDIWFSFLKTGETEALRGICDHNVKDIFGLARLFSALGEISASPLEALETYPYDPEQLALHWRKRCRQDRAFSRYPLWGDAEADTGAALLAEAAARGYPRSLLTLAIEAEWRNKDPARALAFVETALALEEIQDSFREDLYRRRERLLRKTGTAAPGMMDQTAR